MKSIWVSAARANQTYQKRGKGKGFWSAGQLILSFIQGKKSLIPTDEKIPKPFETIILKMPPLDLIKW